MPLYEYQCETCNKVFEALQKFSDEPLQTHANCGGRLRRLLSPPALQFKGSGWYVTDYGRGNGANAGSSSSKDESPASTANKPADSTAKSAAADNK